MEYKDYYSTLGVARNADEKEIKQAFRKLAQQYHPDKNPGDAAAESKFKEINEAYTVLSDADKRGKYDRFGAQWEQYERSGGQAQDFDWGGWAGGGGASGGRRRTVSPEEFEQMFGGGSGAGYSSFFDTLFGGGVGAAGAGRQTRQGRGDPRYGFQFDPRSGAQAQPQASQVEVKVTLEEAFRGAMRTLEGADGKRFEVNIPRGVKTGSKVRMKGASGQGDIILKVDVLPHPRFTREENNLRVKVPVDLYTAVLGGELEVPTLDGALVLTIPAGAQSGKTFRLRNQGMPNLRQPEQRGDLLVELMVQVPSDLSEKERALFEELRALR